MEPNRHQPRSEARGRRQREAFSAAQSRPHDRGERGLEAEVWHSCGRVECAKQRGSS